MTEPTSSPTGTLHSPRPFDPEQWPKKLNLGCGWDRRDGYLNVDFVAKHRPDLVADVRDLSVLPDGSYQEIVAQDVLEHLVRADGPIALAEWSRLLEPGGILVLRVPNLLGLAFAFTWKRTIEDQQELVQCLFGTQAYDGDYHQNGYTEFLLRSELAKCGFGQISIRSRDEWLFDVRAVKTSVPDDLRYEDCIFMTFDQPSVVEQRHAAQPQQPTPEPVAPSPSASNGARNPRRIGSFRRI